MLVVLFIYMLPNTLHPILCLCSKKINSRTTKELILKIGIIIWFIIINLHLNYRRVPRGGAPRLFDLGFFFLFIFFGFTPKRAPGR